jgi:glycosyltransferase involved in cell wall biosynthesis
VITRRPPGVRILHVVATLSRGGIATSLQQVLPPLRQRHQVEVEVACLFDREPPAWEWAAAGIPVHLLNLGSKYDWHFWPRLTRLLREGDFEIVQAHGWPAILFVALASVTQRRAHYLLSEHNVQNRRRRWYLKPLDRFIHRRYERVIAVSGAVADSLCAWLPEFAGRLTVVHNGVAPGSLQPRRTRDEVRAEFGLQNGEPIILVAASLEHRKGIDVLLQALTQIDGRRVQNDGGGRAGACRSPLTIVTGEGTGRESLERLQASLGLGETVRFSGYRLDLPDLMAAADMLVVPSRWEGCPMVVLEAMALGLPVVATTVGGIPELIEDGKSGLLAPPENPAALGLAIGRLLAEPGLGQRLGRAGRDRLLACFTAAQAATRLAAAYRLCSETGA